MNVSLYQAAAAMDANARWQELISENLASSAIPGGRKREMSFSAVEAGMAANQQGVETGRFIIPTPHTYTNFQPGSMRSTGAPLDFALEGPGFFEVQLPNGTTGYTRDGEFHLNAQGQLTTKQGYLVLGESGPLQFDPSNPAPLSISASGEVSQGRDSKGKLRLAEFSEPQKLSPLGSGFFIAQNPDAQARPASASAVWQGYLEGANTSPTAEMARMITAMRGFEANQRVMQLHDERMGRVISELGSPG